MKQFDPLHFYICQKSLNKIYTAIKETSQVYDFISALVQYGYPELCMKYVIEEELLNTTSQRFSLSLIRDMFNIYWNGCLISAEFSLRLAECNIVKVITDYLIKNKAIECSQTHYIINELIKIVWIIAIKKDAI
ncbi:uncharacterized protein LOC131944092 [Physella acuta]|uniref:uncharacterized protein LOC131944092 n=1 Tax=Physella acuta TaxID=109671 RepID=UPI0027DC316F|nr:uncharacterized protein LOC131944092 [Physella acuta]